MRLLLPLVLATLPSALLAADLAELGRALFHDTTLSQNAAMSCASCHDPSNGYAAPAGAPVFAEGVVKGRFGSRRPPSLAYNALAPALHHVIDDGDVLVIGGNFADGRATGRGLGSPAAEQALAPMLDPSEMAAPDRATLAVRVCTTQSDLIEPLGAGLCPATADTVEPLLTLTGQALAAYQASAAVVPFSSRFDAGDLTPDEAEGQRLFETKAKCAACHVLSRGPQGERALFTDFSYDNLGVPKNRDNPAYRDKGTAWVDPGLAATLAADPVYAPYATANLGRFKVPTLRNAWTGQDRAYMHNGWFRTLEGVVRFYNTRDVAPRCADPLASEAEALAQGCWPAPEIAAGVNTDELGNLRLTAPEEAKIVAFLKTLTDR